ncbi:MAG: DUF58 domain-containing protein [Verrucomicrobiota bacterium]
MNALLTDSDFIGKLESLYLLARKVLGGSLQADRKSRKKGAGIIFADYSEYSLGDDYRAIDWRIYARFETLIIKMFELEEDAIIYLLIDCSRSMESKFFFARQLAAALGYIGLNCLDRVAVYGISEGLKNVFDPCRGRGKVFSLLKSLEKLEVYGKDTDFESSIKEFQARHSRKGVVIIISDFLYPNGFERGLKLLQWNRHEIFCLQVQDQQDYECDLKGDVELECIESSNRVKVTVSPKEAQKYKEAVNEWNQGLNRFCARGGIGLASTSPDHAFESVVEDILRRGGLVR